MRTWALWLALGGCGASGAPDPAETDPPGDTDRPVDTPDADTVDTEAVETDTIDDVDTDTVDSDSATDTPEDTTPARSAWGAALYAWILPCGWRLRAMSAPEIAWRAPSPI